MIVRSLRAFRLNVPMNAPFKIAGGSHAQVENVLVRVRLDNGSEGWGEAAPMPAFNGETQSSALASIRSAAPLLIGLPADRSGLWEKQLLKAKITGTARAAIEIALFDAWSRALRLPLRELFGPAKEPVQSDVTIPIVPAASAGTAAARLWKNGIRTIKIKVGLDPAADAERTAAVFESAPKARLIVDANAGYSLKSALKFLSLIGERGIRPALFEQPLAPKQLDGMRTVYEETGIAIAADESAVSARDVEKISRTRAAQVINIKLMKSGILESGRMIETAKALGLRLMIGGLVESRLAMTASAHLASGAGGFEFIDLDMPFFFKRDPMSGVRLLGNGFYELEKVRMGIGILPVRRPGASRPS